MDLLMNLLEWSRSQTGRIIFTPEIVNIPALILQETRVIICFGPSKKSITIYTEIPDKLSISADQSYG